MTERANRSDGKVEVNDLNGLTVYPSRIQCAATRIDQEGVHNEADSIIIDNFNRALAEIAVNVAQRRLREAKDHAED